MVERTSNLSPTYSDASSVEPKRKWRKLTVAAAVAIGAILTASVPNYASSNAVELELTRKYSEGTVVEIINVGKGPIAIVNVTINDRPECNPILFDPLKNSKGVPADLQVGETLALMSSCRIIRATVETEVGSRIYTFSGN